MKVHFITSKPTLENDIIILRRILKAVDDEKHTITNDWIENAHRRAVVEHQTLPDWGLIYKENLGAIAKSDVVIAETSYENFAVGYQIAVAIQQKKPVLLLRHDSADRNAFVTGVEDGWVRHEVYQSGNEAAAKVQQFLKDNTINTKDMRFNFFIDRNIYNYLRWESFKTGETKSEILRKLVQREISKQDEA